MQTTHPIPTGWQVDPALCEILGAGTDGYEYWRVGNDVYRHRDGSSRWLCTLPAWPLYLQAYNVSLQPVT